MWRGSDEAERQLIAEFSASTEEDRQDRARRGREAGGWDYDGEGLLQFDMEKATR